MRRVPGWSLSAVGNILDPAVVSAAGRSKAVVPVLFLFCVALWFILQGASVLRSSRALCPRVSSFLLALRSPRLGKRETKRELVCVLLVHLFVCFVRVGFFRSSLPLGVGGWLRFVVVALPELLY